MARLMPSKSKIVGGILVVGAGIGLWLSSLLPKLGSGFGFGSGGDSVVGLPQSENASGQTDAATDSAPKDPRDESGDSPGRVTADDAPPDDVLTILVEEHHFAVWRTTRKGNGYFPMKLDDVVQLALKAEPNADGLRVRIVRSALARVTARQKLHAELVQAGIPADSILVDPELRRVPSASRGQE